MYRINQQKTEYVTNVATKQSRVVHIPYAKSIKPRFQQFDL